jgi:CBS domain-containing protein
MIIRDLMNDAVYSCSADQTLNEAAKIMWDHDVGSVAVTDPRTGALCGIVTDRDVAMAAYTRGVALESIKVSEAMGRNVHCASPDHDIAEAHEIMRRHQVRRLPVMNEAHAVVGFLSLNDLALAAADGGPTGQEEEVARTLAAVSRHRNGTSASEESKSEESKPAVSEQAALELSAGAGLEEWVR